MQELKREAPISIYPPVILYNQADIELIWNVSETIKPQETISNLYLHIPFCAQKCEFCYFTSFSIGNTKVQQYIEALKKEIQMLGQQEIVKRKTFHTLYFGGGTPTYLKKEQLLDLIDTIRRNFNISSDCEFCVEVRPGKEATQEKLQALYDAGVNRISMGAQSFVQEVLNLNGRKQTMKEFFQVYNLLRRIGFKNINIDLMSGMIGDTEETWEHTINTVLALHPENITVYKMIIYKSSELYRNYGINSKNDVFVTEDTELRRIKYFYERMHLAGYMESSNPYTFTSSGDFDHTYRMSRTNGTDILGVGLSSNSYFNNVAFQNTHNLEDYFERINKRQLPIKNGYHLSKDEIIIRALVFAIKTTRVDREQFICTYNQDPYRVYQNEFDRMEADGLVQIDEKEIRLIGDAYLFTDDIVRKYLFSEKEKQLERLLVLHKNVKLEM